MLSTFLAALVYSMYGSKRRWAALGWMLVALRLTFFFALVLGGALDNLAFGHTREAS